MTMKVFYNEEVAGFVHKLNEDDWAVLKRTRKLFEYYGFQIGPKYIKKIGKNLWELRAGKIRLFLSIKDGTAYGVHIIYKKSQKLPQKDLKLAIKRSQQV